MLFRIPSFLSSSESIPDTSQSLSRYKRGVRTWTRGLSCRVVAVRRKISIANSVLADSAK